jgi:hypothetical protein
VVVPVLLEHHHSGRAAEERRQAVEAQQNITGLAACAEVDLG